MPAPRKRKIIVNDDEVEVIDRWPLESEAAVGTAESEPPRARALPQKRHYPWFLRFLDYPHHSEHRPLRYENRNDFLFLPEIWSAKKHLYGETVSFGIMTAACLAAAVFGLIYLAGISILTIISGTIALFYAALMLFKLYVVLKAVVLPQEESPFIEVSKEEVSALSNADLPVYTVLIPLYREEGVISQIMAAMTAIDYPKEKLDMVITLEEYDRETIEAIESVSPPRHIRTLILPNVTPKTKPKALNVAFLETKGEFVVIYDAEIIPDPDQLKKAVIAFRKYPEIGCLQTRLDHYNVRQNILTRLFNAEFSFYYDFFLPGLQKLGYPIPLSGHSTHFRRLVLEHIGAWDPYNVTEDCDVGIRLYRMGFKTEVLNSVSLEEATSDVVSWVKQRTRWMKGFIQTSIVHLRHPFRFKREVGGWKNFFAFLLIVPATVLVNIINFFSWILLTVWLLTHAEVIRAFFPMPILYISNISFVMGMFIFTYLNLIAVYKRERPELVKYTILTPFYWVLLALATTRAAVQMITKPHHWEKTTHGTHLNKK